MGWTLGGQQNAIVFKVMLLPPHPPALCHVAHSFGAVSALPLPLPLVATSGRTEGPAVTLAWKLYGPQLSGDISSIFTHQASPLGVLEHPPLTCCLRTQPGAAGIEMPGTWVATTARRAGGQCQVIWPAAGTRERLEPNSWPPSVALLTLLPWPYPNKSYFRTGSGRTRASLPAGGYSSSGQYSPSLQKNLISKGSDPLREGP